MSTIESLIAEATAYAKAAEDRERREGEAYQKAEVERHAAAKLEILVDLEQYLPSLKAFAGYVTVDDLTHNHRLNRADNAQVLVRFPDCELIAFWVKWSDLKGWTVSDGTSPFIVYPNTEEWWNHSGRSFTEFPLALAYAHEAYPLRLAREAETAAQREQEEQEAATLRPGEDEMWIWAEYLKTVQTLKDGDHPLPLGVRLSDHINGLLRRLRQYERVNRQ